MSKSTWADVKKGDVVELGGREWNVVKIKAGKKKADVVVERKGRDASSTVKLAERVKIVGKGSGKKAGPLLDPRGVPRRWATQAEHDAVLGSGGPVFKPGDATVTKPPAKPGPDLWETPADKIERRVVDLLSARLVAETTDESVGFYVPPVNVTTVAAHLVLFHGYRPPEDESEGSMVEYHERQHAAALAGAPLAVNHWHTATRPKTA